MTKSNIAKVCSAILTLLVLTNFSPFGHGSSLVEAQEPSPSHRVDSPKRNDPVSRRFEITQMGEIMDDGVRLSFTAFKAADGTKLTVEHHEFESKDQARDYLQKAIGRVRQVTIRKKKTNSKGDAVGERAQVALESTKVSGSLLAVLWTDGVNFYEVLSASLPDILETEKSLSR
jgi:hypothetical protein